MKDNLKKEQEWIWGQEQVVLLYGNQKRTQPLDVKLLDIDPRSYHLVLFLSIFYWNLGSNSKLFKLHIYLFLIGVLK